jgi:hypothetical protein
MNRAAGCSSQTTISIASRMPIAYFAVLMFEVRWSRREKALRCAAEPSQKEQRMLTGGVAALGDAGDGRRADRVIRALSVQHAGLRPDLIRDLPPAQSSLEPLAVHRLIQRDGIKCTRDHLRPRSATGNR